MTQWQDKTRGGDPVENVRASNLGLWKWVGDIINPDGSRYSASWTERGYFRADERRSGDDLIPIEAEAPSPAKARVDLALAAYSLRAAVANMRYAEDAKDKMGEALFDAFVACGKTEVVVKIDGQHYYFWVENAKVFFRKIEVL